MHLINAERVLRCTSTITYLVLGNYYTVHRCKPAFPVRCYRLHRQVPLQRDPSHAFLPSEESKVHMVIILSCFKFHTCSPELAGIINHVCLKKWFQDLVWIYP